MRSYKHEEIEELLGAYALDAVDPDEVEAVERHLEGCPRCRSEVAGHREVATLLANTGGDAPAGVWERIAGQLEEAPPPLRLHLPDSSAPVVPLASRRGARATRIAVAAVGIAAALAIGVLGTQVVRQQQELDRFEAAIEEGTLLSAANTALRDPRAVQAALQSFDGSVTGQAVILPDGTGYLLVHQLPALDDGTYQLWGQTEGGLISLGLLGDQPGAVIPFHVGDGVAALAITAEEPGGVLQSKNPAVLAGSFD